MTYTNGTTKYEPTVAVERRRCPCCHEWANVTISETSDGREIWWCHTCDGKKEWKVR